MVGSGTLGGRGAGPGWPGSGTGGGSIRPAAADVGAYRRADHPGPPRSPGRGRGGAWSGWSNARG